jgi:hypothetical protein
VIVGSSRFGRAPARDAILSTFASAIGNLKTEQSIVGSMFPELHHLSRATQNLILVSGSSYMEDQLTVDPVTMLTTLAFPQKEGPVASTYFFGFTHVVPTPEMMEEEASVEFTPPPADAVAIAEEELASSEEEPLHEAPPEASGLLHSEDLGSLLDEPSLVGDSPVHVERYESLNPSHGHDADESAPDGLGHYERHLDAEAGSSLPPAMVVSEDLSLEGLGEHGLAQRLREALAEADRLRQVSHAMSEDIKRLMRERRQPTTDRELRDSNERLQVQNRQLTGEKLKALELIATREKQIELMREQMEMLKKEKKAA